MTASTNFCRLSFGRTLYRGATGRQDQATSFVLGYHLPGCRPQRIEDAMQIDIDHPVPVFVRVLEKGFLILIADSGIGEARIDSAVTFDHTCHAALYGGLV